MRPRERQALLPISFSGSVFPSELVFVAEGVPAFVKQSTLHCLVWCLWVLDGSVKEQIYGGRWAQQIKLTVMYEGTIAH